MKEFEDELKEGLLSILIVDDVSDIRANIIKMIVSIGTDWVVFSDSICGLSQEHSNVRLDG